MSIHDHDPKTRSNPLVSHDFYKRTSLALASGWGVVIIINELSSDINYNLIRGFNRYEK